MQLARPDVRDPLAGQIHVGSSLTTTFTRIHGQRLHRNSRNFALRSLYLLHLYLEANKRDQVSGQRG
jgi:hypothetical protein